LIQSRSGRADAPLHTASTRTRSADSVSSPVRDVVVDDDIEAEQPRDWRIAVVVGRMQIVRGGGDVIPNRDYATTLAAVHKDMCAVQPAGFPVELDDYGRSSCSRSRLVRDGGHKDVTGRGGRSSAGHP
jgi:hypothetical protein